MRLIDAKMVNWDGARWVALQVTEAVKRIMTRGRRNGGFEVHVRDMEETILDAKTVIDPTICTPVSGMYFTSVDLTDHSLNQCLIQHPKTCPPSYNMLYKTVG